jgi:hypothetical protein
MKNKKGEITSGTLALDNELNRKTIDNNARLIILMIDNKYLFYRLFISKTHNKGEEIFVKNE